MNPPFRIAACISFALAAGGCTVIKGEDLAAGVDRSLITGSIAPASSLATSRAPAPDRDAVSDSRTVRNAVSAADLASVAQQPLAWANAETGASGAITTIVERRQGPQICRAFTTSRQRYDGVALFDGETCTAGDGEWTLTRFSDGG